MGDIDKKSFKNSIIAFCLLVILLIVSVYLPNQKLFGSTMEIMKFNTTIDVLSWMIWFFIVIVLIVFLYNFVMWFVACYNEFYRLKNNCEGSFNQIRVAMKKRFDLITQLNHATSAYSHFERETLEGVTQMRAHIENAAPDEIQKIESESKFLTTRLFAVVENYPELKASNLVIPLMSSIHEIENEIAKNRYTYNGIVQQFNTLLDTIPNKFLGKVIGLHKLEYISFEEKISTIPLGNKFT